MNKKTPNTIIQSPEDALCFAVLERCIWAGKAKSNAMVCKVCAQSVVVKLSSVVGLKSNKRELKLSVYIGME